MFISWYGFIIYFLFAAESNGQYSYSRYRRQSDAGCLLPDHPVNGRWKVVGENGKEPGATVESEKILLTTCNKGYKVDGTKYNICLEGQWTSKLATCSELCPAIASSDSSSVTCTFRLPFGGSSVVKCTEAINGTIAEFKCKDSYKELELQRSSYSICAKGRWNPEEPECSPACGRKPGIAQPQSAGGKTSQKAGHPWQVALYAKNDKKFLCGGSLINQRVILTAAHCVCDSEGNKLPAENYLVAMGKYYRKYDEERDINDAQFSKIRQIFAPSFYKSDKQNYLGDIAILVTERVFSLTKTIQPVCVDWSRTYDEEFFNSPKNTGYIAGWGTTQNDTLAEVLQELEVPYIDRDKCSKELPEDYVIFLTDDKVCSGYRNQGKGVCRGDSGGGLVTKSRLDGKFYITGIVSNSPPSETGACDPQEYALYTKVSIYITTFINEIETLYRPPPGSCVLPEQPLNGRWKVNETSEEFNPGDLSLTKSVLILTCDDGFILKGLESIRCFGGSWTDTLGTCESPSTVTRCPLPQYPSHGKWKIVSNSTSDLSLLKPGDTVASSTILNVLCDENYGLDGEASIACISGAWSEEIGICHKKCSPLIIDGQEPHTCYHRIKAIDCSEAINGTLAVFRCPPSPKDSEDYFSTKCLDGAWQDNKITWCII